MEKTVRIIGVSMDKILGYAIPFVSCILGILGYERLIKKDNTQYTKDMTILITKVDMLLIQSTNMTSDVKKHDEMLITHDVKIQNIEHTLKLGGK